MKAFATIDGHLFWGQDAHAVVSVMRKTDFVTQHDSNRSYMKSVYNRLKQRHSVEELRGLGRPNESVFLEKLAQLEYIVEVTDDYECPIVHSFCNSRRNSCEGENAYCWLKKQDTTEDGTC